MILLVLFAIPSLSVCPSTCGNGKLDEGEICDGPLLSDAYLSFATRTNNIHANTPGCCYGCCSLFSEQGADCVGLCGGQVCGVNGTCVAEGGETAVGGSCLLGDTFCGKIIGICNNFGNCVTAPGGAGDRGGLEVGTRVGPGAGYVPCTDRDDCTVGDYCEGSQCVSGGWQCDCPSPVDDSICSSFPPPGTSTECGERSCDVGASSCRTVPAPRGRACTVSHPTALTPPQIAAIFPSLSLSSADSPTVANSLSLPVSLLPCLPRGECDGQGTCVTGLPVCLGSRKRDLPTSTLSLLDKRADECSGHGSCSRLCDGQEPGECECTDGYSGYDCAVAPPGEGGTTSPPTGAPPPPSAPSVSDSSPSSSSSSVSPLVPVAIVLSVIAVLVFAYVLATRHGNATEGGAASSPIFGPAVRFLRSARGGGSSSPPSVAHGTAVGPVGPVGPGLPNAASTSSFTHYGDTESYHSLSLSTKGGHRGSSGYTIAPSYGTSPAPPNAQGSPAESEGVYAPVAAPGQAAPDDAGGVYAPAVARASVPLTYGNTNTNTGTQYVPAPTR